MLLSRLWRVTIGSGGRVAELAVGPAPAGTACVCRFGSESGALAFKNTYLKMAENFGTSLAPHEAGCLRVRFRGLPAGRGPIGPLFALCVSLHSY